jgi:phage terminase Nu1 subunit (DNA packaging protein)
MDISINKLSELTGIDRRTVKKRLEGLIPCKVGRAYNFDSTQALAAIYANVTFAQKKDPDTAKLDYDVEKARLAKEKADAQELKNAETRRELVPVAEVAQAWGRIVTGIRNQFLALPNRLAQMLETTGTTEQRRALIDREVKTILEALADEDA